MESMWVLISLITIFFRINSKIHSVLPIMWQTIYTECMRIEKVRNKKWKKERFFDMSVHDLILESFAVNMILQRKKSSQKNHHKSRTDQKLYNKWTCLCAARSNNDYFRLRYQFFFFRIIANFPIQMMVCIWSPPYMTTFTLTRTNKKIIPKLGSSS